MRVESTPSAAFNIAILGSNVSNVVSEFSLVYGQAVRVQIRLAQVFHIQLEKLN